MVSFIFCGAKIMQTSGKRTRSQLPECSLSYAKILFIAFLAVTKKSAKISLFADSFRMEMYEKVSITILRRVHAEIVCHIAAEVGRR